MNARTGLIIPALGAAIEGGLFHGIHLINGELWGEVTAPKTEGEIKDLPWLLKYVDVPGAAHAFDGLANTVAMAEAGSPLAIAVRALRIGGLDDWYLPARGGLLMQWGNLQPLLAKDETLDRAWYWSSTQFSRFNAYYQHFGDGDTNYNLKAWEGGRARAVRRFRAAPGHFLNPGDLSWT